MRLLGKAKLSLPIKDLEICCRLFVSFPPTACSERSCSYHITSELVALHWLPVSFRIYFRILLLVFKALSSVAPSYLSELLHQHVPVRTLWSSTHLILEVPYSRLKPRGDRAFSVASPILWNSPPLHIGAAQTLPGFDSLLKTHFFKLAF